MVTILGAGGPVADSLTTALARQHPEEPIRLVGRKPTATKFPGATIELLPADLTNPEATQKAVAGARIAYLVAGLEYNVDVWRESWPRLMNNVLDACRRHQTRLVFFDNVYMYGPSKAR